MKRTATIELVACAAAIAGYVLLSKVADPIVAGVVTLVLVYGGWALWRRRRSRP
ncbi:MAG: hypothetical protein JWO69_1349 [Thermoleophilia bacterium]|nr:hypothetical protein [Thermoleophilia bacterium]